MSSSRPPFRIGATSFVYPTDWVGNVERLAGRVGDVEVLMFEAENLPSPADIATLAALADHGHTYTVHTPLSASLASADDARRARGVAEVIATIERSRPLSPHAWIVHVYLGDAEWDARPADLDAWRHRARDSLRQIVAAVDAPDRICVETIDYDFDLIVPVVRELGLGIAWDVGHYHRDGRDPGAMLRDHLDAVRVIQWHGTDPNDRDHRSLQFVGEARMDALLTALLAEKWDGVLTLEVFRESDFEASLALTAARLERLLP